MIRGTVITITLALVMAFPSINYGAPSLELKRQALSEKYPPDIYVLGIGESRSTGSDIRDYRVAEVMARREIAQQVRVAITSVTLDFACEGAVAKAYRDKGECRDDFLSIIQASTAEFLSGSRIVDKGRDGEYVYVIVAMPRRDMAAKAEEARDSAINKARQSLKKAGEGNGDAPDKAREALMRAKAYDRQARAMDGIRDNAEDLFRELEAELEKLK